MSIEEKEIISTEKREVAKPKKTSRKKHVPAYVNAYIGGNMRRQAAFWLMTLIFFCIFLYIFSSVLLPFVVGIVLAYFLNPIIELMQKIHISRMWATVIILATVVFILVSILMIFVPLISTQLGQFKEALPSYIERMQKFFEGHSFQWVEDIFGTSVLSQTDIKSSISAVLNQGSGIIRSVMQSILDSGKSIFGIVSLCVIAPVVTFYMLLDWDNMVETIDSWIPRDHLETIRGIFREMDRAVAGFIRGQGTVCLILSAYYGTGLTLTGLNFGLLIGVFVGIISFIPYIGSFTGLLLAVGVAWTQFYPDNWQMIIVILCIFFAGQFTEGYILQPKLVGSSVGLHPVWLMFALVAFGYLFGFTGMLLAVPASAAIGVLVRFALHVYLGSPLYAKNPKEREHTVFEEKEASE